MQLLKRLSNVASSLRTLSARLRELRVCMRAEGVDALSRRYFAMNAFDGAMTVLSIVVSAYMVGNASARIVVGVGLASCVAMGVSGVAGAYMTERAERLRRLKELEGAMLKSLKNSVFDHAFQWASFYVALVDGIAPIIAALVPLFPFILELWGFSLPVSATYASLALNFLMLFLLGVFLGRVSKENVVISGFRTLLVGFATALICVMIGFI